MLNLTAIQARALKDYQDLMACPSEDFYSQGRLSTTKVIRTAAALNCDDLTAHEFADALAPAQVNPSTARIQYNKARACWAACV